MTENTAGSILSIGNISVDVIIPYGRAKQALAAVERGESTGQADSLYATMQPGGTASNSAATMAQLGCPVVLGGTIGGDMYGDFLIRAMQQRGVDCRHVGRQGGTFLCLTVLDEEGERVMLPLQVPGQQSGWDLPVDIPPTGWSWVFVNGVGSEDRGFAQKVGPFVRACRQAGAKVALDLNLRAELFGYSAQRRAISVLLLLLSDVVFGSGSDEVCTVTGQKTLAAAALALAQNGGAAVVRDGTGPVLLAQNDTLEQFAVQPVQQVRNKVGAGDCFDGAFLAALYHGRTLKQAVAWGNACAADAISRPGYLNIRRPE